MHEALVCRRFFRIAARRRSLSKRRVRHFWQLELDKRRHCRYGRRFRDQFVARRDASRRVVTLANEFNRHAGAGYLARLARHQPC